MQHLTHPSGFPSFTSFLSSLPPPFVSYLSISVSVRLELAAQNETPPLFDSIRELKWIKFDVNHHLLTVRELFSPDGTLGYWVSLSLKKHRFLRDVTITHGSSLWLTFQTSNTFSRCNKYLPFWLFWQMDLFFFLLRMPNDLVQNTYSVLTSCGWGSRKLNCRAWYTDKIPNSGTTDQHVTAAIPHLPLKVGSIAALWLPS